MPAVSFYLKQDTLDAVRTRAKTLNIPVSTIIREAIEEYIKTDQSRAAKKRVLDMLVINKPLGGMSQWEDIHRERTEADADRS
jgi:hypothetical protein